MPMPDAPDFEELTFDKEDNPYQDGVGYIEKLNALAAGCATAVQYVIDAVAYALGEVAAQVTLTLGYKNAAETAANTATTQAGIATTAANTAVALAGAFSGTSTSNLTIGTGAKALVTQSGEGYTANVLVMLTATASPTNWMFARVTDYTDDDLTVDVTLTSGAGTYDDWTIALCGVQGPVGPQGEGMISNIVTTTADYTFTTTRTLLRIAPTGYGKKVKLCAASGMTVGAARHAVEVTGPYPVLLTNTNDVPLGFLRAGSHTINLGDTADELSWSADGLTRIELSYFKNINVATALESSTSPVSLQASYLGSGFYVFLFHGNLGCAVMGYNDNTKECGAPVAVRSGDFGTHDFARICKIDATRALVATHIYNGTSFEAVQVSLNTGTLACTVGTAASKALAAAVAQQPSELLEVNGSFVISYTQSGPATRALAITVTGGGVVAIGNEATLTTPSGITNASIIMVKYDADSILVFTGYSSEIYTACASIATTVVTPGNSVTETGSNVGVRFVKMLTTGRCAAAWYTGSIVKAGIYTITGNTVSRNTGTLLNFAAGNSFPVASNGDVIVAAGAAGGARTYANGFTDSAGTPSIGTELDIYGENGATIIGVCVNKALISSGNVLVTVDCTTKDLSIADSTPSAHDAGTEWNPSSASRFREQGYNRFKAANGDLFAVSYSSTNDNSVTAYVSALPVRLGQVAPYGSGSDLQSAVGATQAEQFFLNGGNRSSKNFSLCKVEVV